VTATRKREPGYTGVWVGEHKVAALGVKISRWVTLHGVSVNVCPDMRYFGNIVPCGIRDKPVGSLSQFARAPDGGELGVGCVSDALLQSFLRTFSAEAGLLLSGEQEALPYLQSLKAPLR
jgi:lipoyl(octanoyl) transferase